MRGSIVVLALAITPLAARVSIAQGRSHVERREMPAGSHAAAKCAERQRGNPSDNGLAHRADPRTKGNKNCTPSAPPPSGGGATGMTFVFGTVFNDLNGNGSVDAGEGLAGWTVSLSGAGSASTSSDASGAYTFESLMPGTYTVCVSPPAGWALLAPSSGPSCSSGFGYQVDAPTPDQFAGELWYNGMDFWVQKQ